MAKLAGDRRHAPSEGPLIARPLEAPTARPSPRWHLDELVRGKVSRRMHPVAGRGQGELLDLLVQHRRRTEAASKQSPASGQSAN